MHNSTGPVVPTANIAVNRNRLKHYDDGKVYLADKTQFEIELYNPKQVKVMAMIYLNGQAISSSGLVLNPGQRYFLDRWLDRPDRFRFDVYDHDGTPSSQAAIAKNGDVRVEFFDEKFPYTGMTISSGPTWTYTADPIVYTTNAGGSVSGISNTVNCLYFQTDFSQPLSRSLDSVPSEPQLRRKTVSSSLSSNTETGRVGHGSASSQSFIKDSTEFNPWYSSVVTMKIMPESHKPVEQIRSYCTNCGTRKKSEGWKFCPVCGTAVQLVEHKPSGLH